MLICGEFGEMVDVLGAGACVSGIPEGTAPGAESVAQLDAAPHSCASGLLSRAQRGFPERPGMPTPLVRGRQR